MLNYVYFYQSLILCIKLKNVFFLTKLMQDVRETASQSISKLGTDASPIPKPRSPRKKIEPEG